ncbi:MAG: carboxypeptidase regulatory-like domain-containing protein [Bacteroidota bacterium]
MKNLGFLALMMLLVFSACRKDVDDVNTVINQPTPPVFQNWIPAESIVTSSVIGFVVDENQQPVADVEVRLGNFRTTTDEYGHFFYNNLAMNALGTVVTVEKDGYFEGSRRFFPIADAKNRVKIELLPKVFSESFEANTGATIDVDGGASIVFAPNSIQLEDGGSYDGEVNVAAKWMDPSSERTLDQMPGNLQGVNTQSEEVALATYGMIAVELEGSNGEALNIAEGATATLQMPVPANMQADAPNEIPLWAFYESHGVWAQESSATLENGVYVGEVSHFSFWNCDAPFPLIVLNFRLVDGDGFPLANYKSSLERSNSSIGYGWSNASGEISGKVPKNEELILTIFDECGNTLYTQTVGPFSMDTNLGDITITGSNINSTIITGRVIDCNGDPITDGLVTIDFDGRSTYEYIDGGNFEVRLTTCDANATGEVVAINFADFEQSTGQAVQANILNDLGDVQACGQQLTEFLSLTVDGQTMLYPDAWLVAVDSVGAQYTYINFRGFNSPVDSIWGNIEIPGITVADYSNMVNINLSDFINNWQFEEGNAFDSFEITSFGAVGEDVVGEFSGTLTNYAIQPAATVSVTGAFRLKRQ